ncbi:MAG TPA: CoA-binding protein, partial [Kiloniellaceae bacterium]|nr:CoA-binding protein [Kiloniellaceae bacterium]
MTPPLTYSNAALLKILRSVKTIAMVGASTDWSRPSYFAMKYLQEKGYRVIPVNPAKAGQTLLGETIYGSLSEIPDAFDMVDIFRRSDAVPAIVEEACGLAPQKGIRVIWMQLGVVNHEAAARAEAAGMTVVMDRCPKIEFGRLHNELSWGGFNSRVISA